MKKSKKTDSSLSISTDSAQCKAEDKPTKCNCTMGHRTQNQCYHWPCPCAEEARAWFRAHKAQVEKDRAKAIATMENPLCVRCESRLAHPGYMHCQACLEEMKRAGPVVEAAGSRQIEVE